MIRRVALDTETTGLEVENNHRIIEIGCVELIDRRIGERQFHRLVNPERAVDAGALAVHGMDEESLKDKPLFRDVVDELLDYIEGAELLIHNAKFDLGFLDAELARLDGPPRRIRDFCTVVDTVGMARAMFPGQRVSLDALCRRFDVDRSARTLHGALIDAQLLAEVYLAMTAGQSSLDLALQAPQPSSGALSTSAIAVRHVLRADDDERAAHSAWLDRLDRDCEGGSVWRRQDH